MALCAGDRVQVLGHAEGRGEASRMLRGRGAATDLFGWLQELSADGATALSSAVRGLQAMAPAPGITFLISDLLTPDWEQSLARLAAGRGEACILQVFSPEEYQPTAQGDLKLVDAETEETREITMGPSVVRQYREERDTFLRAVQKTCHRYGFSHLFATTDQPVEDVILKSLRRLQVVQ
jgi:hypothetical protein